MYSNKEKIDMVKCYTEMMMNTRAAERFEIIL